MSGAVTASARWLRREPPLVEHQLSATQVSIYSFLMPSRRADFDVSAPYQRGSVWTTDQRRALIRSIIQRLPTGAITYSHDETSASPPYYRVVDGKQRLETLWAFADDKLAIPADWLPDEDLEPSSIGAGGELFYSGLSQRGRRGFENNTIAVIELNSGRQSVRVTPGTGTGGTDLSWGWKQRTREEAIAYEAEVYGLINSGGTAQTDVDLTNARRVAVRETDRDPLEIRCRHGVPSGRRGIVMPEDQHPSEACPECNPPECDVTVCHQLAVTCIVGESGDLWLCSEHAVPAGDGPDDDDYLDRPALGRTHPYGNGAI